MRWLAAGTLDSSKAIKPRERLFDHMIESTLVNLSAARIVKGYISCGWGAASDNAAIHSYIPLINNIDALCILPQIDRGMAASVRPAAVAAVGSECCNCGSWHESQVPLNHGAASSVGG